MLKHGFLGFDASFMMDFVVIALIAIVPVILYSLFVVKVQRNFLLHRNLQIVLGTILLVAVAAFEMDTQVIHGGWLNIVNKNAETPRLAGEELLAVKKVVYIHLIFAITTPFLWIATLTHALMYFPRIPFPGPASRRHKALGWLSTIDLVLTSVTGIWFYYVAFVQTLN
ncbi:DUF420 domain-containing protein [Planctomicrobium sp. SH668]|uniref:DUF420 domain-containing protein n=1 Tax=Planctomicrobium sp. SH668 TaxID=3448126 RepID=UPI003F5B398E